MKSPNEMRIIQIDITNACIHRCANCTRFCGHHKEPYFMSFETFKKAVDSLDGFQGTIGIMGGEPTLHPEFERFVEYLGSKYPPKNRQRFIEPQVNFMESVRDLELEYTYGDIRPEKNIRQICIKGPGLWSAMGEKYNEHYEVIQDNILYQALNDHSKEMFHQPALVARKDLGIPDDEWIVLRDKCWVQNLWSASITPKGAFFCEVAGALDMLFNGPGGWEIEKGWYMRSPEDFKDQLNWCEICGLACDVSARNANEMIDDVSDTLYSMLAEVDSPKYKLGLINRLQIGEDGKIDETTKPIGHIYNSAIPYTSDYFERFDVKNNNISKKQVHIINYDEKDPIGKIIGTAISNGSYRDYYLFLFGNIVLKNDTMDRLQNLVINPGTLHITKCEQGKDNGYFSSNSEGTAILLNPKASAIKKIGIDSLLKIKSVDDLIQLWSKEKIIEFVPTMERCAPTSEIKRDLRYVIYGAGTQGKRMIKVLKDKRAKLVAIVDSDKRKHGEVICGERVLDADYLIRNRNDFDKVIIATDFYYHAIKSEVMKRHITECDIVML